MNDTKWRDLCMAKYSLPAPPRYRIKPLLQNDSTEWDREWYYHPLPYVDIEWLEIDTNRSSWNRKAPQQLTRRSRKIGVPKLSQS